MNYSKDRLDRRVRAAAASDHSPSTSGTKSHWAARTLAADLRRAHEILLSATLATTSDASSILPIGSGTKCGCSSTIDDNGKDRSPPLTRFSDDDKRSLERLREGHSLAGRTNRDCGKCAEATFHFGMAWAYDCADDDGSSDNDCWISAGDYAQMTELAGFPEVGAIALLHHRAGGEPLDASTAVRAAATATSSSESRDGVSPSLTGGSMSDNEGAIVGAGCGCGMLGCGISPCFIVVPPSSPLLRRVLQSMDAIGETPRGSGDDGVTAASILAQLTLINRRGHKSSDDQLAVMRSLLVNKSTNFLQKVPENIRFWEDSSSISYSYPQEPGYRNVPPVIQLLLLKLLYASPGGGSSLRLACESLPFLAASMPLSSDLGRKMARDYKSHWAYFILIRALVLGERVKMHRREKYHVPVWDIVRGMDRRFAVEETVLSKPESQHLFSDKYQSTVETCSCWTSLKKVTRSVNFSRIEHKFPRISSSPSLFHPPLFVVGDSHVLSIGWQTMKICRDDSCGGSFFRTAVPYPCTGLKAWHTRPGTEFFTNYNLHACLKRLPNSCRTVILSAGEIDCREGIGGSLLEGYYNSCNDAVMTTVNGYVKSVSAQADQYDLQVLLMPVAPHAYRSEKNGKSKGRAKRRERTLLWNNELRAACKRMGPKPRVFFLDYEEDLRYKDKSSPVGFVLNVAYNADYTHVNSAILPLLESAMANCGCDLNQI